MTNALIVILILGLAGLAYGAWQAWQLFIRDMTAYADRIAKAIEHLDEVETAEQAHRAAIAAAITKGQGRTLLRERIAARLKASA